MGTITKSSFKDSSDSDDESDSDSSLDFAYRYVVNGRQLDGTSIEYGDFKKTHSPELVLSEYPVGKPVTVYYNPRSPQSSSLKRGIPRNLFGRVAMGFLFLVLSLYMVAWIVLSLTRHAPTPPPSMHHYQIRLNPPSKTHT